MTDPSTNPEPEHQTEAQGSSEAPAAMAAAGASPVAEAEVPAAGSAAATEPQGSPTAAAAPDASSAASDPVPAPSAGAVPPPPAPPVAPAPQAPQPQRPRPVYAKGCVSAAWDDIRLAPDWLKKMLFLGLLCCVPILNFVVCGYALNWAREVPFGGRTAMPREVVTGRNFEVGFYYFVISLAFGLAVGIVCLPVSFVPLLGSLVSLALSIGVEMLVVLCAIRMALSKQLGEGFNLPAVWRALRENWGSVLFISLVPSLVAGAAIFLLMMLAIAVIAAFAVPVVAMGTAGSGAAAAALMASLPLAFLVFLLVLAAIYAAMVVSAFVYVLTFRAMGHYVGRYAPQWADEAKAAMGYSV